VSTLCHELAHLRHFHHGPSFQAFYDQLLEFARDHEIYQPGERARRAAEEVESAPRQLGLFG
jgi:predicted metal-dependent hydrolase